MMSGNRGNADKSLRPRRLFLGGVVVGSGVLALYGCDEFKGIGTDPSDRRPAVQAGALGISIDIYSDRTFRVNADPRRVVLYGLFALEVVPASVVGAGLIALTLIDKQNDEQWILGIACSEITGYMGRKLVHPLFELDVNLYELTGKRIDVDVVPTQLPSTDNDIVTFPEQLVGVWTAYGADGKAVNFQVSASPSSEKLLLLYSPKFDEPAKFHISTAEMCTAGGESTLEIRGSIFVRFTADPSHQVRTAPLNMRCLDTATVDADTQFIKWDRRGNLISRSFWPYRMTRV